MTGLGPRKPVGDTHWNGRLLQAREFRESARSLVTLEASSTYNPAIALMVACAIAYADAITARRLLSELDDFAEWAESAL